MAQEDYGLDSPSGDFFGMPAPYDSRRRLPQVRPPDGSPSPNYSSEPTVNSPSDHNVPAVAAPPARTSIDSSIGAGEDPRDPYRQAISAAQTKEAGAEGELANMNYVPRKRSLGSRIGEGIVGSIFPSLAENIWERPRQQEQFAFQQNLAQKGRQVSALHNATQERLRDLQLEQTGELQHQNTARSKAITDYYNARPEPQVHSPKLDEMHAQAVEDAIHRGVDPKQDPHVQQIEAAITSTQRQGGGNDNEVELYEQDPRKFSDFQRRRHAFDPAQTRPTSDESRINLYRKDPQAFKEIYGDKDKSDQGISDALAGRFMATAREGAKDQLTGEVDENKMFALYDKMVDRETTRRAAAKGGQVAPPADTSGPATLNQARGSGAGKQYSGKQIDEAGIARYLAKAGGDKQKARQMIQRDGYQIPQ